MARSWVDERLGPGAFTRLVAGGSANAWPTALLSSTWYPVEPLVDVLKTVAHQLRDSVENITADISKRNARNDLTSVYRAFLRMAGPEMTLKATSQLWATYVAFAEATIVTNEPGHYIGQCRGIPTHLFQWGCGTWRGFIPTAIEMCGGKNMNAQIIKKQREGEHWMLQLEVKYER